MCILYVLVVERSMTLINKRKSACLSVLRKNEDYWGLKMVNSEYPKDGDKCICCGTIKINKNYKSKVNPYEMEFICDKCNKKWWYD